jgi:Uma2 family endonuclease
MAVQEKLYTVKEFLEIAQLPENENKHLELIDGLIVEMPPSSKKNTVLAAWLIHLLLNYLATNDLGYVTGPDGGYRIGPHNLVQPDVGFISKSRAGGLTGIEFPAAPDLAIEVVSPSETASSIRKKARAYLEAGAQFVWAFYPEDKEVDVITLADDGALHIKTVGVDGILEGDPLLPGLSLKVNDIFARVEN